VSRLSGIGVPAAPPAPALLPPAWSGRAGEGDGTLARALDRAGLEAEAADAFAPVFRKAGGTHPEVAFTYALLCGRAGLRAAAAAALEKASPGIPGTWALPDLALEALYPAPDLGRVRPLADAEGVSTALVLGVMLQESGFDEAARSPAGARGLMQVMPETASRLRREGEAEADLHDPAVSAALGARYLARLLARFPTAGAVAAYNAGEDVVARWMAAWSPASEEEFVAMIPYAETRAYTARVLAYSRDYARRLKSGANEGGERPEASPGTASIPPDTGAAFPRRDRETLPSGRQA
jgi:soluble lytic murein transglycosylase